MLEVKADIYSLVTKAKFIKYDELMSVTKDRFMWNPQILEILP